MVPMYNSFHTTSEGNRRSFHCWRGSFWSRQLEKEDQYFHNYFTFKNQCCCELQEKRQLGPGGKREIIYVKNKAYSKFTRSKSEVLLDKLLLSSVKPNSM